MKIIFNRKLQVFFFNY
jgi:hypothetical protein